MTVFQNLFEFIIIIFYYQFIKIIYIYSLIHYPFYTSNYLSLILLSYFFIQFINGSEQFRPIDLEVEQEEQAYYQRRKLIRNLSPTTKWAYKGARDDKQKNNKLWHQSPHPTTIRSSRTHLNKIQPRVVGFLSCDLIIQF